MAITVAYGQASAKAEMRASTKVAELLRLEHHVIKVDCHDLGSGDLAGRAPSSAAPVPEWWPFRNQLLVTLAAMKAISLEVDELLLGCVETDSSHADGRLDFVVAMCALCEMQEGGIRVAAPAIGMSSIELIRQAKAPLSLIAWAHSCHVSEYPCGECRGCVKHRYVMAELGYGAY